MLEVTDETEFLVAEMGASGIGEITRLVRMARPDIGVVLKVGLAHAGEFGGIEATLTAKTEMVTDLLPTDVADPQPRRPEGRIHGGQDVGPRAVVRAGRRAPTSARRMWSRARRGRRSSSCFRPSRVRRRAVRRTVERPVSFRVLGEHHVMNALAAAASAHTLGVGIDDIVSALESVQRAERWRMEVMGGARGVTIINDAYNASPDSMAAALKTLAQIAGPGERTVAVLGEMSELGEFSGEEHDRIGLLAVRLNIGQLVVVGPAARRMHISTINEGSWDGESLYFDTPDEAYDHLAYRPETGRHGAREVLELGRPPVSGRSTGRIVLVRALLTSGALSMAFTLFLTPLFIRLFRRLQWGQFIRDDGPKSHHAKRGTATMGGIIIILATLFGYFAALLITGDPTSVSALLVLFMMVGLGHRRLHRRLPQDPQSAQPRAGRVGEGGRPGRRRARSSPSSRSTSRRTG